MDSTLALVILIIAIALVFDFINGFHDAANSVATVVATQVLTPAQAVVWAAFFNFVAAFSALKLGTGVAETVGKGMMKPEGVTLYVVMAGLIGAIVWDLATWYFGLPSSSSHAPGGRAAESYSGTTAFMTGPDRLRPPAEDRGDARTALPCPRRCAES